MECALSWNYLVDWVCSGRYGWSVAAGLTDVGIFEDFVALFAGVDDARYFGADAFRSYVGFVASAGAREIFPAWFPYRHQYLSRLNLALI